MKSGSRTSKEKDPISVALITMRHQLGLTQTALAKALLVSLPTIARWESWNPPRGLALQRIRRLAEFHGLPIAADFKYIIDRELTETLPVWYRMQTDQEAKYVKALLRMMREERFAELRPKLRQLIMPAMRQEITQ